MNQELSLYSMQNQNKTKIFLQVAVHLFQAGANIVKLGILKPSGASHDIISYVQGQNHDRNIIGVF